MGLKDKIKSIHHYLEQIAKDLKKGEKGNKAASQRVRTATIKLAKIAKKFRKESVLEEKKMKKKKGAKKGAKKVAKKGKKPAKKAKRKTKRRK